VWFNKERTLSIHSIFTTRREAFYWLAILFTFALGTSAGDLVAEQLNLGYCLSPSRHDGGLGLGTTGTSALFVVTILGLVAYLTKTKLDAPAPETTTV